MLAPCAPPDPPVFRARRPRRMRLARGFDRFPVDLGSDRTGAHFSGLPAQLKAQFDRGDGLFERTQRDADGLGPLYVRAACADCHRDDARGPGLVEKISITEADGVTASPDQSGLAFGHTVRPLVTAGASTPGARAAGRSAA